MYIFLKYFTSELYDVLVTSCTISSGHLENPLLDIDNSQHRPGGTKERAACDDDYQISSAAELLWTWPHSRSSVAFFSKIKPKEGKCFFIAYFDLVLDRSTDKMTTVTLWLPRVKKKVAKKVCACNGTLLIG